MKYCVFTAAYCSENDLAIEAAKRTAESLEDTFCLEEEADNCTYHSTIDIIKGEHNFEVCLSNINTFQLIEDCMCWAVEYYSQKWKLKNK